MVEALTTLRCLALLLTFLAFPTAVFGHRLDEYLQATLVAIEPGIVRLQINLTPGVAVAEKVLAQIDRNNDDTISRKEMAAYAELLKRDLTLRLDGKTLRLILSASKSPAPIEIRNGLGIIQVEFTATIGLLASGAHKLALENRHLPSLSVYLINAAQPQTGAIQVTSQKRTENQAAGEIEFTFHPLGSP